MVALVSALRRCPDGDAACTLTDPSGSVSAIIHADCMLVDIRSGHAGMGATQQGATQGVGLTQQQQGQQPPIAAGCAVILQKVPVLIPALAKRERVLVVVGGCVARVFPPQEEGVGEGAEEAR